MECSARAVPTGPARAERVRAAQPPTLVQLKGCAGPCPAALDVNGRGEGQR